MANSLPGLQTPNNIFYMPFPDPSRSSFLKPARSLFYYQHNLEKPSWLVKSDKWNINPLNSSPVGFSRAFCCLSPNVSCVCRDTSLITMKCCNEQILHLVISTAGENLPKAWPKFSRIFNVKESYPNFWTDTNHVCLWLISFPVYNQWIKFAEITMILIKKIKWKEYLKTK